LTRFWIISVYILNNSNHKLGFFRLPIDVRDEFLTLFKINSPSRKEGALAGYLKKRLLELGAEVYEDHSSQATGSDTGNIIATFPGDESKPVILLAAHMDTIGDTEGIEPLIRDGMIYSNGKTILGADDKAGIAVILGALSILQEEDAKTVGYSHGPIEVLLTVQEEVGLIGVKNLDYNLKSVFGYVLDADGPVGTIVNASPSNYNIDIVVEGKAAHAGVAPEKGINAIVVASEP
jgi:tripeptide aminopeptidase